MDLRPLEIVLLLQYGTVIDFSLQNLTSTYVRLPTKVDHVLLPAQITLAGNKMSLQISSFANLSNMSNLGTLEDVGRRSETHLEVGKNVNYLF